MSSPFTSAAKMVTRELHGVVVSAGLMQKTVKVRVGGRKWNSQVQKWFSDPKQHLVHDPNSSLRLGDVVAITPGWRTSRTKRHVVKRIIAPASVPIEERPPVPTQDERIAAYEAKKSEKDRRRAARKEKGKEGNEISTKTPESETI
ncbi:related to ribosomal protein [Cephalotrichum gorgonifer]|uniref:Related to ribosomal protein n=1 Tax=Cephalotrichum gorgonifer TaxID=2041049 RepID=A0AAE8MXK6_9PEZI|nr:related to ribosomal protein [Cephalotrichum gorgonifer]